MTLEGLNVGPILRGIIHTADGQVLNNRKLALVAGFAYVETTLHEQTDVAAYPASQILRIVELKPGPSEHLSFGV